MGFWFWDLFGYEHNSIRDCLFRKEDSGMI